MEKMLVTSLSPVFTGGFFLRCIKPKIIFVLQRFHYNLFNSLPNDKIKDSTKLRAITDDKINVTQMLENIAEKKKMQVTCIFSFSLNAFKGLSLAHSHTMTPFDAPSKQAF